MDPDPKPTTDETPRMLRHPRPDRPAGLLLAFALSPLILAAASGQAPPPPEAGPALKRGDTGQAVEALQRTLNARLDPSPALGVDGDFGDGTRAALVRFQRSKGLPPTGEVDPATRDALGPPTPEGPPPPSPAVVNAQGVAKRAEEPLDGPPFTTSAAWAVVDGKTGALLAGRDESAPREPASTTKMMTALIVARLAKSDPKVLDETITFSQRADGTPGSTAGVRAGERVPARELLYGLLLPSGNDAAEAFAEHFGERFAPEHDPKAANHGPRTYFVAEMNRVTAELGLAETHFANPHGLPAEGHRSSARDLARLARAALAEPALAPVFATSRRGATLVDARGHSRDVVWANTNKLLEIEGYDGVKTGTTNAAGACLVASGRRGGDHRIVVILGAPTSDARYADARNLFRWAWRHRGR